MRRLLPSGASIQGSLSIEAESAQPALDRDISRVMAISDEAVPESFDLPFHLRRDDMPQTATIIATAVEDVVNTGSSRGGSSDSSLDEAFDAILMSAGTRRLRE